MDRAMDTSDSADDAATPVRSYTAAEAAHAFQDFLDGDLSLRGFAQWLDGYRPGANAPRDTEVEDELNAALLALRALQQGERTRGEVEADIQNARGRLTGLSRQ